MLVTESDLEAAMDKLETIPFHEEKEVGGIKFWCYNAGHVLGATMFMLESRFSMTSTTSPGPGLSCRWTR